MPPQFDIILQKQNFGPHEQVHAAMHMPSHGEFLVEKLAAGGLKSGLIFGLDDFGLNAGALNQSAAEILIVCGADQHFSETFYQGWAQVRRRHPCRVLIVSEPIFSPLAYYLNPRENAEIKHLRMLEALEPQFVLYLSRFDLLEAQKRYPGRFEPLLYSLADPALMNQPKIPWAQKDDGLLYLGKPDAWAYARSPADALPRREQLAFFRQQRRLPFAWSHNQFSFRQCYEVANQFRFQLQARSGYAFHTARTVQSAIVGSLPVLLLHRDELPILAAEAPFARPDENLLIGIEGEFDALLDRLRDQTLCQSVQARLGELMAAGTISQGVQALSSRILALLKSY